MLYFTRQNSASVHIFLKRWNCGKDVYPRQKSTLASITWVFLSHEFFNLCRRHVMLKCFIRHFPRKEIASLTGVRYNWFHWRNNKLNTVLLLKPLAKNNSSKVYKQEVTFCAENRGDPESNLLGGTYKYVCRWLFSFEKKKKQPCRVRTSPSRGWFHAILVTRGCVRSNSQWTTHCDVPSYKLVCGPFCRWVWYGGAYNRAYVNNTFYKFPRLWWLSQENNSLQRTDGRRLGPSRAFWRTGKWFATKIHFLTWPVAQVRLLGNFGRI